MSYDEFVIKVVPRVGELIEECGQMNEREYELFKEEWLKECKSGIQFNFSSGLFQIIEKYLV